MAKAFNRWAYCGNPACVCNLSDPEPCDDYVDTDHPYDRCGRCGNTAHAHLDDYPALGAGGDQT